MKPPVVIIGIGEIGAVLARGFLHLGHAVYPVTRNMNIVDESQSIPKPEAVIVAVGEAELHGILKKIPEFWKDRLVLIQNELLPRDWQRHDLRPTVISVWFEKKKGQDVKVVIPSPIYGPKAGLLSDALNELDIPNTIITNLAQMTFELVRKNVYILTSNIAGLKVGGTVGDLWKNHRDFAESVIADVHKIQEYLVYGDVRDDQHKLHRQALTDAMLLAFEGDPEHACMGRSAPARLSRAIEIAHKAGIKVDTLQALKQEFLAE